MRCPRIAGWSSVGVILVLLAAPLRAGEQAAEVQVLLAILKAGDKTPVAGARVEYSWNAKWHELRPLQEGVNGVSVGELTTQEVTLRRKGEYKLNYAVTGKMHATFAGRNKVVFPPRAVRVIKKGCEPAYFAPSFHDREGKGRYYQDRECKLICYKEVLLKPERNVKLSLKITSAGNKHPLAGAHVQYYDHYALYPPVRGKPDNMWRDLANSDGSRALSRNALSGERGHQANFVAQGHIPDFKPADRKGRIKRVVLRVVKKGFETAYFFIEQGELWKKLAHHSEISLRPLGLISHWPFDEGKGSVAAEATGRGNAGRIAGAQRVKEGGRSALKFDGVDDVVHCGTSPVYEQLEAITVLMWIKPAGEVKRMESLIGRAWRNPYAFHTRKGNGLEVSMFLGNYKGLGYRGYIGGAHYLTKPDILKPGGWNMVGFSYDRTRGCIRMFHNGKVVGKRSVRQKEGRFICVPSNQPLSIGCFDGMPHFSGLMDDVRMYNYELSEQEVQKIYQAEVGK